MFCRIFVVIGVHFCRSNLRIKDFVPFGVLVHISISYQCFFLFLIISPFPAGWESFLTLISKLFLTSSCFYLWISTSNPKLLPPGPQINEAVSLPSLILCILSSELHCCFVAGIEAGVGSVVLTTLTKRRRNSPGVFPAISSFPFLINLIWSHFITVLPAVSFDKSRLLLKSVPSCHLPAKVQPLALPF